MARRRRRRDLLGMAAHLDSADADPGVRRVVATYLDRARSWALFKPNGLATPTKPTVLALVGTSERSADVVVRAVTAGIYERRVVRRGTDGHE